MRAESTPANDMVEGLKPTDEAKGSAYGRFSM